MFNDELKEKINDLNNVKNINEIKNFEGLIKTLNHYAKNNNSEAQYLLGQIHYKCSPKNLNQAIEWFNKAVKQGNIDAQYQLAIIILYEVGTYQDRKRAYRLLLSAAGRGNSKAQSFLGYSFFEGDWIKQNYKKSLLWLTKSAAQGDAHDQFVVAMMNYGGMGVKK